MWILGDKDGDSEFSERAKPKANGSRPGMAGVGNRP